MSRLCFSLGYHMSPSSRKCVISVSSNAFKNVPCCDAGILTDQPHSLPLLKEHVLTEMLP